MKKTIFALLCMMILASHAALAQTSYVEKLAKVQAKQQRAGGSYSSLNNVAQNREEIKAFQKMNKELLKQLKQKYNASSVDVVQTGAGEFLIVISCKNNGITETYVANDSGTLLYYEPIDDCFFFNADKQFIALKKDSKWGVAKMNGELLIPLEYATVTFAAENEEGISNSAIFHPANGKTFITYSSTEDMVNFHDAEGAIYKSFKGNIQSLDDYYIIIGSNDFKGLYTLDGKEIFPQDFYGFEVLGSTGVVKSVKRDVATGLKSKGAKNIRHGVTDVVVPAKFQDVTWDNAANVFTVSLHRNAPAIPYHPDSTYVISYKDDGEKYWDAADYEKVIVYYEGEGFGKPWGCYYMGMAAQAIADGEMALMKHTIAELKGAYYFLPIQYPDNYKFSYTSCIEMYLHAAKYYEEYIKNDQVPLYDATKAQAKKQRGIVVSAQNEAKELYEEYTRQYAAATTKYAQVQYQNELQRAAEEAQNAAIANTVSNGISSLLGKLFK